jgi:hypothetical protein
MFDKILKLLIIIKTETKSYFIYPADFRVVSLYVDPT